MSKKFEYVDDNPGSYFGMLVESLNESNDYNSEVKDYNIYAIKKDGSSTLVKTIHGTIRDVEDEINSKFSYLPKLSFIKRIEVRDNNTGEKVYDESLKEDSEYKTLAKLSNGLEVISYPYGYAVSDGYVADRFVVRDGKYIFDDGRFSLSNKDKEKILSLIKKGVVEDKENNKELKEKKSTKSKKLAEDLHTEKQIKLLQSRLSDFRKSWINLRDTLEYVDYEVASSIDDGYPFDMSFDELSLEVMDWLEDCIARCDWLYDESQNGRFGNLTEDKFVPQDKMSKKAQKELNDKKRGTWGNTNPVTRVQPNKKAYDRKRDKKTNLDEAKKGSKVYIAIGLEKGKEPKILGVYDSKEKANEQYKDSKMWVNISEQTIK